MRSCWCCYTRRSSTATTWWCRRPASCTSCCMRRPTSATSARRTSRCAAASGKWGWGGGNYGIVHIVLLEPADQRDICQAYLQVRGSFGETREEGGAVPAGVRPQT
eukprot:357329-Chlamydomonas_euryale.AAC.1